MSNRPDPLTLGALVVSWLAAVAAIPASLLAAASGQGLGTAAVGGGWIGVCLAWKAEVWALVNQPMMNFSASWLATGYWLGSWALPFAFSVAAMPLSVRLKNLGFHLVVLQSAWVALVVGSSWQVFLDAAHGHLSRWLRFHDLPTELRWLAIIAAVAAAVPMVLRLLSIARITRTNLGRARRLILVVLHLFPVPVAWATVVVVLRRDLPVEACIAAAAPLVAGLFVAWVGYPRPLVHGVTMEPRGTVALLLVALVAGWTSLYVAGRPLPGNRTAAVQWAEGSATNNIRDWMDPWRAPWLQTPAP